MERLCQIDNHNKPFTLVCTNPKCKSNRLFCFKCLESSHSKCLNYVLEIADLEKRTLSSSLNWVRSDEVKKAAMAIEKYGLNTFEENFYKAFEELADQEFGRVTEYFIGKIQEAKKRVLDDIHDRLANQKVHLKEFDDKLKGLYNFDAILGILDQFQSGENDMERTSHDLQIFLEETSSKESQNREIHAIAKRVNSFNDWYKELDGEKFEMFKQCIPFQIFAPNNKPQNESKQLISHPTWTWDARNVSDEIMLSGDRLMARKTSYYSRTKQPVFGSIIMANGRYQWELDFTESAAHQPCFVSVAGCRTIFGIIDRELLNDLDDVPTDNIIGLTLGGKQLNMQEVHKIDSYKKKKFMLDLNLNKGTFCISENGLALCVESFNLKGRSFVPIVVFFCVHDRVFLKALHSEVELKKETENDKHAKMMKSSIL